MDFASSFFNALVKIGLNPFLRVIRRSKENPNHKDIFRVNASSISFCKWYSSMSIEELENFVFTEGNQKEFIRGFFESEGSLSPYPTFSNTNLAYILLVQKMLEREGFRTSLRKGRKRNEKWKIGYTLAILGGIRETRRFINEIKPVIKNKLPKIKENFKDVHKEEIEELYFNRNFSINEISEKLDISLPILYKKMRNFNIPKRGQKFYRYAGRKKKTT